MGQGGPPHVWLARIRERHALSIHGVCLSVGGADPLDCEHLARLAELVRRYEPALVSEHLAWCAHDGVFYNDLIAPLLDCNALTRVAAHVDQIQEALGRQILIENPSQYVDLPGDVAEPDFLNELAARTGCALLLDINNVVVSAHNLGFDAARYLAGIDARHIAEIHLAGHATDDASGLKIDDHGSPVGDETAALFGRFIARAGARPTLIEWDTDTPDFAAMCSEAARADGWMRAAIANANSDVGRHA